MTRKLAIALSPVILGLVLLVVLTGTLEAATWDEWLNANDTVRNNCRTGVARIVSQTSRQITIDCRGGATSTPTLTPTSTATTVASSSPSPSSTATFTATPTLTPVATLPPPATPTPGTGNVVTITNGVRYSNSNALANTTYTCAPGVILDGQNATQYAFHGGGNNVTVQGCTIQNYTTCHNCAAVSPAEASGWLIQGNEIRNNHDGGIDLWGSNHRAIGNNVHHNGQFGISGGEGSNILIENNDIHWNNTRHVDGRDEAGGGKVTVATGVTWRNNRVSHNSGPGLWCDESCRNVVYEGNVIWNNGWGGIWHEISYDAQVRNNTFTDNGRCDIPGVMCDPRGAFWRVEAFIYNAGHTSIQSNFTGNTLSGPNVHLLLFNQNRDAFRTWNWHIEGNGLTASEFEFACDEVSNCSQVQSTVQFIN